LPGGNGTLFDWTAIDKVKTRVSYILSGGLNPDNVSAAIEATGAVAVDVSSGVEIRPGEKDVGLIARFIAIAKSAPATRIVS
jgi:phosphoribosylanthranilate isomerase